MNHYHLFFDLASGKDDLELAKRVKAWLDHLRERGLLDSWRLERRKLGFGIEPLGEFHVDILTEDLVQLDAAFSAVAPREGEPEALHAAVYALVRNFRACLYRDFPDPERSAE